MYSFVIPIDPNRLVQFAQTKMLYDLVPQKKEFNLVTRHPKEIEAYLKGQKLFKDVKIHSYHTVRGFNPAKAFNIGVRNATYDNIIICSPEVMPVVDVLGRFDKLKGKNIICQVFDATEVGDTSFSLVNTNFRSSSPAMYFLAMFQKKDIEMINGWDEAFMDGYAYEDDDFGARWNRAGLPFEMHDEIQAIHQYHPRSETISGGLEKNRLLFHQNNENNVVRPKRGLVNLDD